MENTVSFDQIILWLHVRDGFHIQPQNLFTAATANQRSKRLAHNSHEDHDLPHIRSHVDTIFDEPVSSTSSKEATSLLCFRFIDTA